MGDAVKDLILEQRNQIWTPELEKLLRKWKNNCSVREKGHLYLARKYSRRHYTFGLPAVLLGAATSTSLFATFQESDDNGEIYQWVRFVMAFISLSSTTLTAVMTFFNYQEASEINKNSADEWSALYRQISNVLILPLEARDNPVETLRNIRNTYDELRKSSPTLPRKYDRDLSYEVLGDEKKKKKTLEDPNLSGKTKAELNLLLKTSDDDEGSDDAVFNAISSMEKKLQTDNDHNTSDDEVTIPFDLDAVPPTSPARNYYRAATQQNLLQNAQFQKALAGQINAERKTKINSLQYELQRLKGDNATRARRKSSKKSYRESTPEIRLNGTPVPEEKTPEPEKSVDTTDDAVKTVSELSTEHTEE